MTSDLGIKPSRRLAVSAAVAMLVAFGITQNRTVPLDAHQLDNALIANSSHARTGITQTHGTPKVPPAFGFGKTRNMYTLVSQDLQDPLDVIVCDGRVIDGGWGYYLDNPATWQVTFGGSASMDRLGRSAGQEQYTDHNPVDAFDFHSTIVTDVTCFNLPDSLPGKGAVIAGQGKVTKLTTLQDLIEN